MPMESETRFWDRYIEFLTKSRIKSEHQPWYVRHIKRFVAKTKGVMLANHDTKSMTAYLEYLGVWSFSNLSNLRNIFERSKFFSRSFLLSHEQYLTVGNTGEMPHEALGSTLP